MIRPERVRALHRAAIDKYKGLPKEREHRYVEARLGNIDTALCYCGGMPDDALLYAAYALIYFCKGQGFVDGNKRVAWLVAVEVLLHRYRVVIETTTKDAYSFVMDVVKDKRDFEILVGEVSAWFAERMVPADKEPDDYKPGSLFPDLTPEADTSGTPPSEA